LAVVLVKVLQHGEEIVLFHVRFRLSPASYCMGRH
jgi:hypothetical protein